MRSWDTVPGGLMRPRLGIDAVVVGVVGVLLCAAAVGLGWWVAVKAAGRVARVAPFWTRACPRRTRGWPGSKSG